MKIQISQMSALAMLEATLSLSADLRRQIEACPAKADQWYLETSASELQRGLEGVRSFVASGKEFNKDAYKHIEAEIASLVGEIT